MTAANISCDNDGRIAEARIAVGACSTVAMRLPVLEQYLIGKRPDQVEVTSEHVASLAPVSDMRGSAEFRFDVVRSQSARAIMAAAGHG